MNAPEPAGRSAAMVRLQRGASAIWRREAPADDVITMADVVQAQARFQRFAPVLKHLFPESGWDGRIRSSLQDYPAPADGWPQLLVKTDHALPITGSIKARGGVHELLCQIERIARDEGLSMDGDLCDRLTCAAARECFSRHTMVVASTGNLGFSIGLLSRAFGLAAEIHMSHEAKEWKKERLRQLGAHVVEHECDFSEAVSRARDSALANPQAYFVDDETSRELMLGYAVAAQELTEQLAERDIVIGPARPLYVYLPCGVGGAPGGVTYGLKQLFGRDVVCVLVEPTASASMFVALSQAVPAPVHVGKLGLDNRTIADGLAVPCASPLALAVVGRMIDAVVAVADTALLEWVQRAWRDAGLRLEPAAAAGFAALEPWFAELAQDRPAALAHWRDAVHVVWTTGGSLLPQEEFDALLQGHRSVP